MDVDIDTVCLLWQSPNLMSLVCLLWQSPNGMSLVCLLWQSPNVMSLVCLLWHSLNVITYITSLFTVTFSHRMICSLFIVSVTVTLILNVNIHTFTPFFAKHACGAFFSIFVSVNCDHTTGCEAYSFTTDGYGIFNVRTNLGACRTRTLERGSGTCKQVCLHKSWLWDRKTVPHPAQPGNRTQELRIRIPTL